MVALGKLISLAQSPTGKRLLSEAQKTMQDPKNRERIANASARLQKAAQDARRAAATPPPRDEPAATGPPPPAAEPEPGEAASAERPG